MTFRSARPTPFQKKLSAMMDGLREDKAMLGFGVYRVITSGVVYHIQTSRMSALKGKSSAGSCQRCAGALVRYSQGDRDT